MREAIPLPAGWPGAVWPHRRPFLRHARHRHAEPEANLVLAGRASYLLEGRRIDLGRHHLLWLPPGQEHLLMERSDDFAMWIMVVAADQAGTCPIGLRRLDPAWTRAIAQACALLETGAEGQPPHPGLATGEDGLRRAGFAWLLRLCQAAWAEAARPAPVRELHPAVLRAARRLAEDPAASLPGLAREAGLSPDRLGRLFRRELGVTLVEHRSRQRLDRFLDLATGPDANLLHCALQAGFGSYMQFHRVFRRRYGVGPRAWLAAAVPGPER